MNATFFPSSDITGDSATAPAPTAYDHINVGWVKFVVGGVCGPLGQEEEVVPVYKFLSATTFACPPAAGVAAIVYTTKSLLQLAGNVRFPLELKPNFAGVSPTAIPEFEPSDTAQSI